MSFQLFVAISIIVWLSIVIVLLVVTVAKAQSPLLQEISRLLSFTPASPENTKVATERASSARHTLPRNVPAYTTQSTSLSSQQISYQKKLAVLGAYLDRQQRTFTAIWELSDGYLLQTVRAGSSQIDYLKVSNLQLNSLAEASLTIDVKPGFSSTLLGGIGGVFDQRRATTVQLAVVGRNVVTGGLELTSQPDVLTTDQRQAIYRPFQDVFAMPSSSHPAQSPDA